MTKEVFILVYECPDKSAFRICGVTTSLAAAQSWSLANGETKVFLAEIDKSPIRWDKGIPEWHDDDCVEKKK